jgi:hypothetical protein
MSVPHRNLTSRAKDASSSVPVDEDDQGVSRSRWNLDWGRYSWYKEKLKELVCMEQLLDRQLFLAKIQLSVVFFSLAF